MSITADEIKSLRKTLGLTQAKFAGRLNLTQGAIAQWENGHCSPSGAAKVLLRQLRALAETKSTSVSK